MKKDKRKFVILMVEITLNLPKNASGLRINHPVIFYGLTISAENLPFLRLIRMTNLTFAA
jgi:hypothetical protein